MSSPRGFVDLTLDSPSPAESFAEPNLDLNRYVIKHPSSTFYMRVSSNNYQQLNIFNGDLAVVDRSLLPAESRIIVVANENGMSLLKLSSKEQLRDDAEYWGTVTHIIRKM